MLRQILAVTSLNIRGLSQRLVASSVIVVGIMCVVGVLVSVLTMAGSNALVRLSADDRQ